MWSESMALMSITRICKTTGTDWWLMECSLLATWRPCCLYATLEAKRPKFRGKVLSCDFHVKKCSRWFDSQHSWWTLAYSHTSLEALCKFLEIEFNKKRVVKRDCCNIHYIYDYPCATHSGAGSPCRCLLEKHLNQFI